jgi:predicted RNA-binding Zn-ribbon protein involved in translation (DUF1610 family)
MAIVNHDDADANMYGCYPCPKCGSVYRASYDREEGLMVECDDCGLTETATDVTPD